jgi:dTDP-4-dehydrorhamnose 3,5-epimerase
MPFEFIETELKDVLIIKPKVFGDKRGFFLESYKKNDFYNAGIKEEFNQDNHSKSTKGVLRGLHFQLNPKSQAKIVRCVRGKIYDVAVDIRKNSPTYKKWIKVELSEDNKQMIYIPVGFAHGFVVLSEEAELIYKATNEYAPDLDGGIRWNDSDINVDWGIDFTPIISDKDASLPAFKDARMNFEY